MGNLSDTSRQTVTTVLNELKAVNLIHFTRRYIVIRNLDALFGFKPEPEQLDILQRLQQ